MDIEKPISTYLAPKNIADKDVLPTHYIGIGASAGGLEALQTLLQNLPTKTGACFVIVQHLSPDFKSMMRELLSKHTTMAIENVEDGVLAKANTIYLLPPKKNMIVAQGELLLADKVPDSGLSLPIDVFFRSLSEDQQHRAIGIILSGTGSDGSRGIKALKEAGALVIAQDPESAKFDGMPNSAINTGIVDFILRPEDMGKQLAIYVQHPLVKGDARALREDMEDSQDVMQEIFNRLRAKSEIDFANYKPSTVARRIERRMTIKHSTSLKDYLSLLYKDDYEVKILSRELLIGVTRFFRDDDAFSVIKNVTIPVIVANSSRHNPIRVWIAACSSGEEAYSIAILLHEEVKKRGEHRDIKVFATDVNPDAIAEAGAGIFTSEILNDVPSNIITDYFVGKQNQTYQIVPKIRNSVVFAEHNMIIDPPFSHMDLVTCRNVLIYFQQSVQKRVLSSIHFALKKGGYLFLGSSESLGDLSSYFKVIDERAKVFQKITDNKLPLSSTDKLPATKPKRSDNAPSISTLMRSYHGNTRPNNSIGFANEALITQYVPPCILLDNEYQALHVYGDTNPFVRRLPPGRISTNIADMVNEDISIAVLSALQRAKKSEKPVFYTDLKTLSSNEIIELNLRVTHVKEYDLSDTPSYYWLVFEVIGKANSTDSDAVRFDVNEQSKQRIADLESDLKHHQEHLQVTVEELETTNEELQSTNEELMSSNEELQSTNEELQSVNEELYTVNSEFQEKLGEISRANGDLDEVLNLSKIGIVFLDENMLIRRFTEASKAYVNLLDTDIDRPLHHISMKITYANLLADIATVFETQKPIQTEMLLEDKSLLRVTINSYVYNEAAVSRGVAITFADITKVKYMEMGMNVAYKQLRSSVNNALDMLDDKPFSKALNVLVLDDSQTYLEVIVEQLNAIANYETRVVTATTCEAAIALVENQRIDVCIVDFHLVNETAIDFLDGLTKLNINVPTIVVTSDSHSDLTPILFSHGALDLIEKEHLSSVLLDKSIRYAVRRHQIDKNIKSLITSNATLKHE